jgi:D-amino-acid dehydrogenase
MHIAVLGCGIAGVTTAWELLRDGHQVTLIDRGNHAANFTSFANAGLLAPGHAYAWASARAPGMMLRSLWRKDQAIRFRPQLDPHQWQWVAAFLRQCNDGSASINTRRKARLCSYSLERLQGVAAETDVDYDGNKGGLLYFYRSASTFESATKKCEILREQGVEIEVLDTAATIERDPGLAQAQDQIAGSLYSVHDESGDAQLFSRALLDACQLAGADVRFNTLVIALQADGNRIRCADTTEGTLTADAFVLSFGVYSPHLVRSLGMTLPVYPVKGYSVTLPVRSGDEPPSLGGVDEDNLFAYCPMGSRLRLTATAEISGYDTSHKPKDFRQMMLLAHQLLPNAADYSKPTFWAGLRPMTPTGLPLIDRTDFNNLWLNTGHGHMGWTMSCGSARITADLIGQRQTAIPREGMTFDYGRQR